MEFFRTYRWAIGVAVFVGLCAVAPALMAPLSIGDEYHGVLFTPLDDEEIYLSRINEILDGHGAVSSPYLYEYKHAPMTVPPVHEWLYAIPAFVFGLPAVALASKFLLPAVLFFLMYFVLRRITQDELTAIAGGLLTFFSVEFVDYGYMLSLLQGGWPRPLLWTRLVNPIVGAIELFAFLNLIWLITTQRTVLGTAKDGPLRRFAPVAAGIILALSVGYYFSFGIALALLSILFLVYVYRRDYAIARELAMTGALGFFLSIPYWYSALTLIDGSKEIAMRGGMFFTHAPVFNKLLIAATLILVCAFAYAYARKTVRGFAREWIFAWSLIFAGWIAFNQQVLTGREIWHHHFVQYAVPLSTLAVVIALYTTLRTRLPRLWKWGMAGAIALSCMFGLYSTLQVIPRLDTFEHNQSYGALFDWLDTNAEKDCVVYVHEKEEALARFIPAYSSCNVYTTTVAFYGVPRERVTHNFFLRMRLFDIAPESAEEHLRAPGGHVRGTFFEDWNQALMNTDPEWFDQLVPQLATQYREFAKGNVEEQIQKYRIDYLVSEEPLPQSLLTQLPDLQFDAQAGTWRIYKWE